MVHLPPKTAASRPKVTNNAHIFRENGDVWDLSDGIRTELVEALTDRYVL